MLFIDIFPLIVVVKSFLIVRYIHYFVTHLLFSLLFHEFEVILHIPLNSLDLLLIRLALVTRLLVHQGRDLDDLVSSILGLLIF